MGLDIQAYRQWEDIACRHMDSYRPRMKHTLDVFEKYGFPVRLKSLQDLHPLINAMQEGRFDAFMSDMQGLNADELEAFCTASETIVRIQAMHTPEQSALVPFDAMISALSAYAKIKALKPDFTSVLEFGPGCGYVPLFLAQTGTLEKYTQVEACESFFFLQNIINQHLFGERFETKVSIGHFSSYKTYSPKTPSGDGTPPPFTVDYPKDIQCSQYPWWNIAALADNDETYDIVTSNANLLEFSTEALHDYLPIMRDKLKSDGLFFVQCFGYGGGVGRKIDDLWDAMYDFKLAPLFITSNTAIKVQQLLSHIPSDVDNIVLMPAGLTSRQLVHDKSFCARFKSVTLIDQSAKAGVPDGIDVIAPSELAPGQFDYALILHSNADIVKTYSALCEDSNLTYQTLDQLDCIKKFAVPYGVFVGEHHPLFKDHYARENYDVSGSAQAQDRMNSVFFPSDEGRTHYSEQQIFDLIQLRF